MKEYMIFVDAAADLDPRFLAGAVCPIVPMRYTLGDESRLRTQPESEELLHRFYDGQRSGDLTQTSQASPQQYMEAFTPVLESGRGILYLALSGGLTGSGSSVSIAKTALTERFPDAQICTVDSLSATGGIGLLAECAVKNRTAGMSVWESAAVLGTLREQVCHLFMVDDLMYLKRGGRVDAATAVVGTALGIHPILIIDRQGSLNVVDKRRGQKHTLQAILSRWQETRDPSKHRVVIAHADAPSCAQLLADAVLETDPEAEITSTVLNPIIGAHTGPGMAALIYFGDRAAL